VEVIVLFLDEDQANHSSTNQHELKAKNHDPGKGHNQDVLT